MTEEIKKHPQAEEETTDDSVVEGTENEEISEEIAEALEDYDEESEETESENEEQSIYDDADDEFMESVTPQSISPEKAAEKEKQLIVENEELQKRVDELEAIDELRKHQGWEFLMENLKSALHILVDKEDSSLSKNAKKIEEIKAVRETLGKYSSELFCKKNEIKANERELERLKAIQKKLFDGDSEQKEEVKA